MRTVRGNDRSPTGGGHAFCRYCGSYSNPDGKVYQPDRDKRTQELKMLMHEALQEDDKELWREFCFEYCLLALRLHPEQYPNAPQNKDKLHDYAHQQVTMYELLVFDAGVKGAFKECSRVIDQLKGVTADHIQAARRLLDAYRKYFTTYLHHPDYPFETRPGEAEQQAVDTARSAINQYTKLWGKKVIAEIMVTVFGDRKTASGLMYCDSCRTPLDVGKESSVTCPSCGSVTYLNK